MSPDDAEVEDATPLPPDGEEPGGLALYTKILIALVLGSLVAIIAKSFAGEGGLYTQAQLEAFGDRWIQPVGDLFIRAIILTVVPLVFASLTNGIYKLGDLRALGRMGGRTLAIFLGTALVGSILATLIYQVFQPGQVSPETRELLAAQFAGTVGDKQAAAGDAAEHFKGSFFQILLSLVPSNIVDAMTSNRDLLKVILFSLLFGAALTSIDPEKAEPVARFIEGLNEVMIRLITILMHFAPYGVFALVFMVVARFGADVLYALAYYTGVVLIALLVHLIVVLMPLVRIIGGWPPIAFMKAIQGVWITAFSTSSSSATLPTTMKVAEENLGVPQSISSFVLPLGATVNMDGTTIYQIVAIHFIAQVFGVPLGFNESVTLIFVAMTMAIGAAGVPGGVIPLLYVVAASVGLPDEVIPQGIALILGMDRILDMCRSSLNVVGDTATATIIASMEGHRNPGSEPDLQSK